MGGVIADPLFRRQVVGTAHYGQLELLFKALILTFGMSMWGWGLLAGVRPVGMIALGVFILAKL